MNPSLRNPLARLRSSSAATDPASANGSAEGGPPLEKQVARLRARVAELEKEVRETQRLSRRVAELSDLVQELLVPAVDRDDERVRELLERYDPGR